ncbi:MAG: MATE family efflux transporter [Neisseriaceae bacterium]|nr:MATE family efflux transporter [Neisseriaceae bacterium]
MPVFFRSKSPAQIELGSLLNLAIPMFLAQLAQSLMGFIDTVMAGRLSTDDLAATGLGAGIWIVIYVLLLGVVTALNPMIAQEIHTENPAQVGEIGRQGMWFGTLLGCVGVGLTCLTVPFLYDYLTLDVAVKNKVSLYLYGIAIGFPAAMLHRALYAYAASLNRATPMMFISFMALLLNIPLNYIFIYGHWGAPALGGAGCGIATGLIMWFNAGGLLYLIHKDKKLQAYGLLKRYSPPNWSRLIQFLKLGLPIGFSYFVEVTLFVCIALLIADLGTISLAAHQSALNFTTVLYMMPQSLAAALSVRVAQQLGANAPDQAQYAIKIGLGFCFLIAFFTASLMIMTRHQIIALYVNDPVVITLGANLLVWSAGFQLFDAAQTVASGALRGYKKTKIPMMIHLFCFWGVGLGGGYLLAKTHYLGPPQGVTGFWQALVISLFLAMLLLVGYCLHVAKTSTKKSSAIL